MNTNCHIRGQVGWRVGANLENKKRKKNPKKEQAELTEKQTHLSMSGPWPSAGGSLVCGG